MTGRDDGGFVTAEWAVGIALLVLPVMLLMAVLPTWAARHEAASAAAREATRAATALVDGPAATEGARSAARVILSGRGVDVGGEMVIVDLPPLVGGLTPREGEVRVTVSLPGEVVDLPMFGEVRGPTVTAAHARQLNPYRGRQ